MFGFTSVFEPFGPHSRDPFQEMQRMMHDFHSHWPYQQPAGMLQGPAPTQANITIEELPEGEQHQTYRLGTPAPRVEEPGEGPAQSARTQRQMSATDPTPSTRQNTRPAPRRAASSSTSYFSSSTSFSQMAGGSGGVYYSSSSSSRMGPGGVMEHSETMQDGRTGESSVRVSRFLGDRGRTITRMRSGDGQETGNDDLHNLREDEASAFHQDWTAQAAGNLLPHMRYPAQSQFQGQYLEGPAHQPRGSRGRYV